MNPMFGRVPKAMEPLRTEEMSATLVGLCGKCHDRNGPTGANTSGLQFAVCRPQANSARSPVRGRSSRQFVPELEFRQLHVGFHTNPSWFVGDVHVAVGP
jgi:hypothetical protein